MKTTTKFAVSLMTGIMAIVFSAFTTGKDSDMTVNRNAKGEVISVTNTYYRLPAYASNSQDTNASHYIFSNSAGADCDGDANICSSRWTTANAPGNGDSPASNGSPVFVADNSDRGVYNGE